MGTGVWDYYYGNQVSYGAGSWFRAIIGVMDDGGNTGGATTVYYRYSVQFLYSINDNSNSVNWSSPFGEGNNNNYPFVVGGGGGEVVVGGPWSGAITIVYGGSTAYFGFTVSGLAGVGGTSLSEVNYPLPARIPTAPNPPSIGVDSVTTTSAHIFCTAGGAENGSPTDLINYRIYRVSDGAHMGDITGGYSGVTYTNLAVGTTYDAYAQARNAYGWGGFSPVFRFSTPAAVPGAPPISVTDVTASSATVNVFPAAPNGAGVDAYAAQLATDAGFSNVIRSWSGGSGAVSGLTRTTAYYARAAAHNGVGWGPWSTTASFTTGALAPGAPGTPTFPTVNPDSFVVNFAAPGDNGGSTITSYNIQVATNNTFTTGVENFTASSGYTVTGRIPGTQYYVRVRAVNAIGPGPYSAGAPVTTMAGIMVKVDGVWRNAKLWVKVAGNWVPAKVWKKNSSGNWVI